MKCSIHRWNISRALDSGEPLGNLTKLHLVHCEACREFLRIGEEMGRRLADDAASLLGDTKPGLHDKIRQTLDQEGRAISPSPSRPMPLRLKPLWAAAAALVAAGAGLIWMVSSRPAGMPRLDPLFSLETQRVHLVSALQRAESPYEEEISELRKTLQSTADYLAARFVTGLGGDKE